MASWYGGSFQGHTTANGEVFDRNALTAAHPSFPIPSYVRVTNLDNSRSIVVRVNDRGPYVGNRLIDVSEHAADLLAFRRHGLTRVRVDYLSPAPAGAHDAGLLAASYTGPSYPLPTRVAFAEEHRPAPGAGAMTRLTAPPSVTDRILTAFDVASATPD